MVMHSAVVAMTASFLVEVVLKLILEITCKVKNIAALRTRTYKCFFLPDLLAKVKLLGAEIEVLRWYSSNTDM